MSKYLIGHGVGNHSNCMDYEIIEADNMEVAEETLKQQIDYDLEMSGEYGEYVTENLDIAMDNCPICSDETLHDEACDCCWADAYEGADEDIQSHIYSKIRLATKEDLEEYE